MEYLLVPDLRLGIVLAEDLDPCVIAVDLAAFSLGVEELIRLRDRVSLLPIDLPGLLR